mmetsp:Transcript_20427/g.63339  ORF Transcript_20427/g.63339 Transcript_20427/m.63339 type:complete len:319 (+) Transcript_20427:1928-2884(+)
MHTRCHLDVLTHGIVLTQLRHRQLLVVHDVLVLGLDRRHLGLGVDEHDLTEEAHQVTLDHLHRVALVEVHLAPLRRHRCGAARLGRIAVAILVLVDASRPVSRLARLVRHAEALQLIELRVALQHQCLEAHMLQKQPVAEAQAVPLVARLAVHHERRLVRHLVRALLRLLRIKEARLGARPTLGLDLLRAPLVLGRNAVVVDARHNAHPRLTLRALHLNDLCKVALVRATAQTRVAAVRHVGFGTLTGLHDGHHLAQRHHSNLACVDVADIHARLAHVALLVRLDINDRRKAVHCQRGGDEHLLSRRAPCCNRNVLGH